MNVRFLNPFLEAAYKVLQAETGLTVSKGKIELEKSALTTEDITVLISLVGEVQGVVMYGMSEQTCMEIVNRMIDQKLEEFNDFARSGISELGNVITGQASIILSENGLDANISPPTLVEGKSAKISMLDFSRVVVPMEIEVGRLTVHLALRESPAGQRDINFVDLVAEVETA